MPSAANTALVKVSTLLGGDASSAARCSGRRQKPSSVHSSSKSHGSSDSRVFGVGTPRRCHGLQTPSTAALARGPRRIALPNLPCDGHAGAVADGVASDRGGLPDDQWWPSRRARMLGVLRAAPRDLVHRLLPTLKRRYQRRALQRHAARLANAHLETSIPGPVLVKHRQPPKATGRG